ncbi:MAG: sigma 54-interacting transcriptional regulator [Syntrophomonadaceae bacterium]|nr:sigma 54-interacting transcriptional regulator [Syntrophomonadaceae bacterium]
MSKTFEKIELGESIAGELMDSGTTIIVKSSLKVRDFMRQPLTLTVKNTLQDGLDIIIDHRIDGVPILDDRGALVGLVTKTLVLRELAKGTPVNRPVGEMMITNVAITDPDEDVSTLIAISVANLPVVDKDGAVVGIVTLSDTIRAYFSSVLKLEQELNTIINSMHNGLISVNEEGLLVLINSAAESMLGVSSDQVKGKPLSILNIETKLMDVLNTGGQTSGKFILNGKSFISNRTPIKSNGRIIGAVAVFQDISELEMISEELDYTKRMKEELDAIIESSFDGIFVSDGNGKPLRVNEAYSRITGIPHEMIMGQPIEGLINQGFFKESATLTALERRERVTISQEIQNGNTILVTSNPVFDEYGNIVRVVNNARDISELDRLRDKLVQAQTLSQHFQEELNKYKIKDDYVIHSQKMKDLMSLSMRLGQVNTTVLIQGESGVGKEIIARTIHGYSHRNDKPMISINCAAIPESLLESELFGYAPGAFTGAKKQGNAGILEIAHEGTLFLDEVGELPLNMQSKLLRVLQQREITRIGSTEPIKINVRLIAATNRDLWEMVLRKEFRRDLFYRLNVVPIMVPPLRERREEIPFLIAFFLKRFNEKYGFSKRIDDKTIGILLDYDWPGNVRELENLIERLVVTSVGNTIREAGLPGAEHQTSISIKLDKSFNLKDAVAELERELIQDAVNRLGSSRKVAKVMGVSQPTIVRKAARYGINLGE